MVMIPMLLLYHHVGGRFPEPSLVGLACGLVIINTVSGYPLMENIKKADMHTVRAYGKSLCDGLSYPAFVLLRLDAGNTAWMWITLILMTYSLVYNLADTKIHLTHTVSEKLGYKENLGYPPSIATEQHFGLPPEKLPKNFAQMWEEAPRTPGISKSILENTLWRSLVFSGEKEDRYSSLPPNMGSVLSSSISSAFALATYSQLFTWVMHGPPSNTELGGYPSSYEDAQALYSCLHNMIAALFITKHLKQKVPLWQRQLESYFYNVVWGLYYSLPAISRLAPITLEEVPQELTGIADLVQDMLREESITRVMQV